MSSERRSVEKGLGLSRGYLDTDKSWMTDQDVHFLHDKGKLAMTFRRAANTAIAVGGGAILTTYASVADGMMHGPSGALIAFMRSAAFSLNDQPMPIGVTLAIGGAAVFMGGFLMRQIADRRLEPLKWQAARSRSPYQLSLDIK